MNVPRLSHRPGLLAGVAALVAAACSTGFEARAQAVLPEVQVTTAAIPDYEFDSGRNGRFCASCNGGAGNALFAFTAADGRLWVGSVDFQTGAFYPPDGRGVLVDTETAPVADFGNGPEWMSGSAGSSIVYTRYVSGSTHGPSTAQIAVASMVNGAWSPTVLPGSAGRATPDGSKDTNDADPRVNYIAADKDALYWRRSSALGDEVAMPISDLTGGNSRRWVPGTRKIIFQGHNAADPRLVDQVYTYDTDSGAVEQLTFDAVGKYGAFMWKAPEYNNEHVFFTMADYRRKILVYRKIAGTDGVKRWTVIKTITPPAKLPFFWSPEVFTHNGRSYIFTVVSPSNKFWDKSYPTHLAISGIDPLKQNFRMLTNDTSKPRLRLDPEYFITAKGPFIYYNRMVPATTQYPDGVNDGVWYVDTGLGAPLSK
ncbi:hypothetical protein [Rubrivivax benzoatilyticus]|uniref:hypothetical protein n=1 Tax=Rubrivivax benzoatilyticus TaxID=316997 RepID=UPI00020A45D5|nr:hypothetical protein [Rubrivivax benzoatilyticus]EGJ11038.1 hypothetical protein RBXJA2T_11957 [Rubrivivax benzoatilyticus JA2 = ATCC BAA-35]MCD0417979.1 hypothetical protein [Rubrivivax sp. JA1024]